MNGLGGEGRLGAAPAPKGCPLVPCLARLPKLASGEMVVYEPSGLHQRVAGGWPDEAKPTRLELLCHRRGFRRGGRDLMTGSGRARPVGLRGEGPQESIQALAARTPIKGCPGVCDRRLYFAPVADDRGV
jgi:hypothetical protein